MRLPIWPDDFPQFYQVQIYDIELNRQFLSQLLLKFGLADEFSQAETLLSLMLEASSDGNKFSEFARSLHNRRAFCGYAEPMFEGTQSIGVMVTTPEWRTTTAIRIHQVMSDRSVFITLDFENGLELLGIVPEIWDVAQERLKPLELPALSDLRSLQPEMAQRISGEHDARAVEFRGMIMILVGQ